MSSTEVFAFENQTFTPEQLYQQLGFSTYPSDRELEAKLIMFIRKYNGPEGNERLYRFFNEVYDFFFDTASVDSDSGIADADADAAVVEGFENKPANAPTAATVSTPVVATTSSSTATAATVVATQPTSVNAVDYPRDVINPILKQTIQRIVVVDSAYRNLNATNSRIYPYSTNFTIELSEPLRDVLSLNLYSYSIPYTWYTVSKDYGSNFIYLKGTSPGLIDFSAGTSPGPDGEGPYDFKIEISAGNYNAVSLTSAINTSISKVASQYTELSLGSTGVSYNSVNTLATFTIDIQNIYHENSFQLNWGFDPSDNTIRTNPPTTIPAYLGFLSQTYHPFTLYSKRNKLPLTELSAITDANQSNYFLDASNNSITVIHYYNEPTQDVNGYFYIPEYNAEKSVKLDSFNITLGLTTETSYSRQDIQNNLETQLLANSHLDLYAYQSVLPLQRIDNPENNYSYYQLHLPFLRKKMTPEMRSLTDFKTVVLFPDESYIKEKNTTKQPIWTGSDSCFQFNSFDNASNLCAELNNVYAEIPLFSSTKVISNVPCIDLCCNVAGYQYSSNTVHLEVASNNLYSLGDYFKAINDSLLTNTHFNFPQTVIKLNDDYKAQLSIDYNRVLTNYVVANDTSSTFSINGIAVNWNYIDTDKNINHFDPFPGTHSTDLTFQLENITPSSSYLVSFPVSNSFKLFTVEPNTNPTIFSDISFNVSLNIIKGTSSNGSILYSSFDAFYNDFVYSVKNYSDASGSYPFAFSTITNYKYGDGGITKFGIEMFLNVKKILTQHDFILDLYDISGGNTSGVYNSSGVLVDASNNNLPLTKIRNGCSWQKELFFDNQYNLTTYTGNPSIIIGNNLVDSQTITLSDVSNNNYFYFAPQSFSSGLYTRIPHSTDSNLKYNDIRIDIASDLLDGLPIPTTCNNTVLFNKINKALSTHGKTRGSKIQECTIDNQSYCKFRINLNHTFTAADYVLDFFDVKYFTKCYVGASSVRNTTWDTTLGWILGFHEQNSYTLFDIINADTGIATITGDTSVNTNLYNYLFISVDDFNQNRLNDGVVTIAKTDTKLSLPLYSSYVDFFCYDHYKTANSSSSSISAGQNNLTGNQIYALNQVLNSRQSTKKIYSPGPYLKDVFAVIPLKIPSEPGFGIIEYGGSMQNQNRKYFGPVNIRRLQVQLYTEKGNILDLNGSNWNFQFICEQLYHNSSTAQK